MDLSPNHLDYLHILNLVQLTNICIFCSHLCLLLFSFFFVSPNYFLNTEFTYTKKITNTTNLKEVIEKHIILIFPVIKFSFLTC